MGYRRLDKARKRIRAEEKSTPDKEEDKYQAAGEECLMVKTEGTEEEMAEIIEEVLWMEVGVDREGEGKEGYDGTLRALGAI